MLLRYLILHSVINIACYASIVTYISAESRKLTPNLYMKRASFAHTPFSKGMISSLSPFSRSLSLISTRYNVPFSQYFKHERKVFSDNFK